MSPEGEYLLIIEELEMPDWPFGSDHLRISLYGTDKNSYNVSFDAAVASTILQSIPGTSTSRTMTRKTPLTSKGT